MKQIILLITNISLLLACSQKNKPEFTDYTKYVDPYIGTGYHGHTFMGANVPFGAVQVGPTNYIRGWDWCSGYHYSDSIVTGFSQLHLNGTGIGDLGDVLIMPYTGKIKTFPGTIDEPLKGYATKYSHENEIAGAGYYSVLLEEYNIQVELTASERIAFHRYTFSKSENNARIAINLENGIGWDRPVKTSLSQLNDTTYLGYRFSTGWAKDQRVYFAVLISKPVENFQIFNDGQELDSISATGKSLTGILSFPVKENEIVMLKVGISAVSEENAIANIYAEIPGWKFNQVAADAKLKWNKELKKIEVKAADESQLRTFYTAMYHAFTTPVLFNDVNGDYRGADQKVYNDTGFQNYSIFSLWDTYRAAHPFYTLTQPERVNDFIKTMLSIYQQQGKLPIWHLMGNETDCMVGYSAVPVIADAWFKGINKFDPELMLQAMKSSSMRDDYGVSFLKDLGYIPADRERESVSKALEYAISDWGIAQVAKNMGRQEDYEYYSKRAKAYTIYFDQKSKFMRPKLSDGNFREPLNPFESIPQWGDYTEGNAWQYTWLVPHDVEGLISLFGGDEPFIEKLDSLFVVSGDMGEQAPPDISGLIGQYAHGNEPSHHIVYLYAYAGQQWKTAEKVKYILNELYNDTPAGISGNEDCGQMSAWYILSAMGFYQVNPSNSVFVFGSPLFDEVTLHLPDNKLFVVKTLNNSNENIYIQSAKLNGKPYTKSYITYNTILTGGTLEFTMGNTPNKEFGMKTEDRPRSIIYD